jgi:hypothetical protein
MPSLPLFKVFCTDPPPPPPLSSSIDDEEEVQAGSLAATLAEEE